MIIDFEALDSLRLQILDLEKSVADLSTSNTDYFKSINMSVSKISASLKDAVDVSSIRSMSEHVDKIAGQAGKLTNALSTTSATIAKLDSSSNEITSTLSSFGKISKKFEKLYSDIIDYKKKKRSKRKPFSKRHPTISREAKGVSRVARTYATKLKIPSPKNVLAGTILGMAYAIGEEQRLEAQAGKAKNVLVAAVDGAMSDAVGTATQWLNAFGERMQKFYGISAEEIFKIQNQFTQAGRSIKETTLTHINPALGEVGENAITYTLALDKLYELSSGTMAASAIKYSEKFGISLDESSNAITRMLAAGDGAGGVGGLKFLEYIGQTSDALEGMGYRISDVVDLSYKMSESWKKIGVPRHLAVQAVGAGMKGIAGGMKGMSTDWQVYVAQVAGYGKGLAGRNKMVDTMLQLAKGSKDRFKKDVLSVTKRVLESVGGDEDRARVMLEKGPGWGVEGARLALAMLKASGESDHLAMKELDNKVTDFQGKVVESLETEQSKMTKLQIFYNEWLKGIHDIGMGLMGLVGDSLALSIAFFKALPALIGNIFDSKGDERNAEIIQDILKFQNVDTHLGRLKLGFEKLGVAGKHIGTAIVGKPMIEALTGSLQYSPYSAVPSLKPPSKNIPRASYNQPPPVSYIYLPAPDQSIPYDYDSAGSGSGSGTSASTYAGGMTYGGNYPTIEGARSFANRPLTLVSNGVDAGGNMTVELQGDCPGCGLHFGEDSGSEYTSEETLLATMLESEMGSSYLGGKAGRKELAGVAHTALNRLSKSKKGKTLSDVITAGHGFGKQGKKRAYSTAVGSSDPSVNLGRTVSPGMKQYAREILAGNVANPVGEATHFLHYTKGEGYGTKSKALPPFAQTKKNVENIGKARFYAKTGLEASNKEALDKKYISSFEKKHPGIDPLTGDSNTVATSIFDTDLGKGKS